MVKVNITFYGALKKTIGEKTVNVEGSTLKEAIGTLIARCKELNDKLYDEKGKPRRFVNIYVNGKDIRFLSRLDTELNEGDKVSIIPAVGGG